MSDTRILIVDDDPQFAELLTMRLQFHGYQTLQARDLTTAGYLLETKPVDLILCDLCLGRENGLDLLPVAQGLGRARAAALGPISIRGRKSC